MKKMYETPVVEKVDFDYEENVVASGSIVETKTACVCGCNQGHGGNGGNGGNGGHGGHGGGGYKPSRYGFWFFCWW